MEYQKVILSIVLGLSSPAFATSCPNPVTVVHEGDKAVCDGFLFSKDAENEAATDRDNALYFERLSMALQARSKLQEDENSVLEQRLKLYMDSTASLNSEIAKRDTNESLYRLGYFVLGVLGTSLVVRNLRQ